jgi:hypothetical protein
MDTLPIPTKSSVFHRKSTPTTAQRKRKAVVNVEVGVGGIGGSLDASSEVGHGKPKKLIRKTAVAARASRSGLVRHDNSSSVQDPDPVLSTFVAPPERTPSSSQSSIKDRFLNLFSIPEYLNGISNSVLKEFFDEADYIALAPIINDLIGQSRLTMSKIGTYNSSSTELFYQLVSDTVAQQFHGLDISARMVYQVIERSGNLGIWTKDIRIQTNIQQQALNKIFKALESRQLIKPVKSVVAKSKKLYMLYNLNPSKELTGGVWYSDLEFDHEFIFYSAYVG